MKKILLACDGKNIPKGAFEFIKQLQLEEPVFVTGAFLHSINFELLLPGAFALSAAPALEFLDQRKAQFAHIIDEFSGYCENNGIEYIVHDESEAWNIEDLARESRFADLMIMSEELFCTDLNTIEPNTFMQEAIHYAECPVMLFPESFKHFESLIVAYDGKKDSMHALRQFCNLFPRFTNLKTKIIYSRHENNDDIPEMILLEEFAGRHFPDLEIEKQYFNSKNPFHAWIDEFRNALIICGSFGRSELSSFIKKSFAEDTIREHRNPLFIAHL